MERQTKLVGITSACIDCVALGTIGMSVVMVKIL